MVIAIGSTSEQKIRYLDEVLGELGMNAEILVAEVGSGIPDQPLSSEETKHGSATRATLALEQHPTATIGLGIEVGYHPNEQGDYEMFCWATICDSDGYCVSTKSHHFLLPRFHQEILKSNQYLGDHVRKYFETSPDNVTQQIAEVVRGRRPFIVNALWQALGDM